MVPWMKFKGEKKYKKRKRHPQVDKDGKFTWQRKTGKKTYVYFTSEDGHLKTDRIIIHAK